MFEQSESRRRSKQKMGTKGNSRKTALLLAAFLLSNILISCSEISGQKKISRYFDIEETMNKEAALLNFSHPKVYKVITSNGTKEANELINIDWEKELQPFMDCDINRASWKDSYSGDTTRQEEYEFIRYTAKDSSLANRKIIITFKEGKLYQISVVKRTKNNLYNSTSELVYLKDWGYRISGEQNVRFGRKTTYIAEAYFTDETTTQ